MCVSGGMVMDHEAQGAMAVRVAHLTAKRLGGAVRRSLLPITIEEFVVVSYEGQDTRAHS